MSKDKTENQNEELQAAPELAGDAQQIETGAAPEWSPELSPELLKMDAANEPQFNEQDEPKLPVNQVKQAETLAVEIAGFVAITVESITGKDYGLKPDAVKKWAAGVAPCLVKYGLTDMGEIMSKWGVEIQAGVATASLGFGVYAAHKQYQKDEAAAEKEAKAEKEETKAA